MKRVNFILDDASLEILQKIKKEKETNFSSIVRKAIKLYYRAYKKVET